MTDKPEPGTFRLRPFMTDLGTEGPPRPRAPEPAEGVRRRSEPTTDAAGGFAVRPYLLTAGRVRPVTDDLELEAQVVTTDRGRQARERLTFEHRDIIDMCVLPRSVAEIAAMLGLHLGVARILAADAAALGYLTVLRPEADWGRRPELIERVIRGLNAIF